MKKVQNGDWFFYNLSLQLKSYEYNMTPTKLKYSLCRTDGIPYFTGIRNDERILHVHGGRTCVCVLALTITHFNLDNRVKRAPLAFRTP